MIYPKETYDRLTQAMGQFIVSNATEPYEYNGVYLLEEIVVYHEDASSRHHQFVSRAWIHHAPLKS